jgi:DNA-binding IclR family transcriptional regulator
VSSVDKAAARVADILDFLLNVNEPASAARIGAALHLPRSSAHDLLHGLSDHGYLQKDSHGLWTLGRQFRRWHS